MRRFYLHKRNGIFYAELIDPSTQKKLTAHSTGKRNEDEARDVVRDWLRDGIPDLSNKKTRPAKEVFTISSICSGLRSMDLLPADAEKVAQILKSRGLLLSYTLSGGPGAELFNDFLKRFWDYNNSSYVKEKLAHGQRITHEHCTHSFGRVRAHWFKAFKGKRLAELTKSDVKSFSVSLADPTLKLAAATRNRILIAGTAPLRWAYDNDLITSDITAGLVTFSGEAKTRGVLTPEEATSIFKVKWTDERARIGSLLAATTGLRLGEVRAIRAEDIDEVILHVRHAWTDTDGLKTPKNGETRRVPLIPSVRSELLTLLKKNPNGNDGYVFWQPIDPNRPCSCRVFSNGLIESLIKVKAGDNPSRDTRIEAKQYWADRAVTFHSWRHFYAARMADHIGARKIMLATGHKTRAVFDIYADHALESDLAEVNTVAIEVFEKILPDLKTA
jgi:integrase